MKSCLHCDECKIDQKLMTLYCKYDVWQKNNGNPKTVKLTRSELRRFGKLPNLSYIAHREIFLSAKKCNLFNGLDDFENF